MTVIACHSRVASLIGVAAAVAAVAACDPSDPSPASPRAGGPAVVSTRAEPAAAAAAATDLPPGRDAPTPALTPAREAMRLHAAAAELLRQAVVAGDLAQAKRHGAEMTDAAWLDRLEPSWRAHAAELQRVAPSVGRAHTVRDAALAVGQLGQACADCHAATASPSAESLALPAATPASGDMQQHQRATELMWRGLVAPAESLWVAGAMALQSAPLYRPGTQGLEVLSGEVRARARRAVTAPVGERAKIYGELLATCATCHRSLTPPIRRP